MQQLWLHIPADPAAAVTEWRQKAREDHGIHFKWRQIHGQIIQSVLFVSLRRRYSLFVPIIDKTKLEGTDTRLNLSCKIVN